MTEFKVGDVVEAWGVRGIVTGYGNPDRAVTVWFESGSKFICFFSDGRFESWHLEPSLKLIERPKKKVTKTVEAWMNIYANGGEYLWESLEVANESARANGRIACVKLTGTYEVEE